MRNGTLICSIPFEIAGLIVNIGFVMISGNRRKSGSVSYAVSYLTIP